MMLYIIAFVGLFAVDILSVLWSAWILAIIWGWFMPVTFGLPPLSMAAAIGVSAIVGMLTYQSQYQGKDTGEEIIRKTGYNFMLPLWVLLVCWVAKDYL